MADLLLAAPSAEELKALPEAMEEDDARPTRATVSYENTSGRFTLQDRKFSQQYSHIYNKRLLQMRPLLQATAKERWGQDCSWMDQIINIPEESKVAVVGTLCKTMRLRPSVLDQYKDSTQISTSTDPLENLCSEDDSLMLEDETGRMSLTGDLPIHLLSTGMVVALKGVMQKDGLFLTEEWCCAGLPAHPSGLPPPPEEPTFILLVSGLETGGTHDPLPTKLLVDYITGHLGSTEDVALASRIARVVVAGSSRVPPAPGLVGQHKLSKAAQDAIYSPMRELDLLMATLSSSVPVDVMPGEGDPAGCWLPQQPMPACMFPHAARFSTLNRVCNPYEAQVGGRVLLGTSGQPVADLQRYTKDPTTVSDGAAGTSQLPSPTRCLEEMLRWRHIAPTAPDTLDVYPYFMQDPFVLEDCPHIFFAGNQPAFGTSIVKGEKGQVTRIVSVPRFSATGEAVLVNLNTLDCAPLALKSLALPDAPK